MHLDRLDLIKRKPLIRTSTSQEGLRKRRLVDPVRKMEVQRENMNLIRKMQLIELKKGALNPQTILSQTTKKPRPPSAESLHISLRKQETIKVFLENQALLNRLQNVRGTLRRDSENE